MTRGLAVLGSAVFFLIAPTTVAGVVPWWISRWRLQAPFFDLQLIRWFGVILILLGIPVLVETFTRFALQGGGTPAPVAPTQHLVITGPNRYVRNPIYLALVAIVLGQGLILGNARLLVYGALLWIGKMYLRARLTTSMHGVMPHGLAIETHISDARNGRYGVAFPRLLGLDVSLANCATVVVILFAHKSAEISAAYPDRI